MTEFNIQNYLNSLPEDTTEINVCNRGLTYLPDLSKFTNLQKLNCSHNKLKSLPKLNNTLINLDCGYNKLTKLPKLNENLQRLDCECNELSLLPNLNINLQILNCDNNYLHP